MNVKKKLKHFCPPWQTIQYSIYYMQLFFQNLQTT